MDDISPSFLPSAEADSLRGIAAHFNPPLSKSKSPLLLAIFCCLSLEAASYFPCNLSLEMAKRNQPVSVIDFCSELPNVRYLMGDLVDLKTGFPNTPDFKMENIKLYGFSKITLFSLALSAKSISSSYVINRIFADQTIWESSVIIINSPNGPDALLALDPFIHFQRALFLMDFHMHSLVKTYSWIKKTFSACQRYITGAVSLPGDDADLLQQNTAKLAKVISKYLPVSPCATMTDVPLDQKAITSIKLRKPLALMEPSSASGRALSDLCENLLSSE
ncbi:MAG: hypothetical protein AB1847_06735 [bacterium]